VNQGDWLEIERVLATVVDLPAAERTARIAELCAGRAELRADVESLLAAHEKAASFLEPRTGIGPGPMWNFSFEGKHLGQYQLLGVLGAGGMGTVYRAERTDGRFEKQVAIKVVPAALHSLELLRRFTSEQQILAGLEHPNIARLLDAGVSPDGIPYLVMEYVDGIPVDQYCSAGRLSSRDRLRLFQTLCSAVHYAHQHLVIHRDLKPANILVSAEGVPKLLDFGVAKIVAPWRADGLDVTHSVSNPMTPAYASPEQARGETLTTATDIYSLGVVLYELLTGQPPYKITGKPLNQAIKIISETEPEKPTAIARRRRRDIHGSPDPTCELAADLDVVVAKAMRKDSQQRYASAEELSSDLARYLDGRPVLAHSGSFRYVARKFISRNKLAIATSLVVLLLALAGVFAIVWQARVAQRERAKAQRRFEQVRSLAKSLMFDVHDSIKDLPGATAARKLIVTQALQYLDGLAPEASDDRSLQRELADAYEKVGDVQGHPYYANLGDVHGALASYQKAISIREAVLRADPQNPLLKRELSGAYWKRGICLDASSDFPGALAHLRKALSLTEESGAPNDAAGQDRLAGDYWAIAQIQQETSNFPAALESYRKAAAIRSAAPPTETSQSTMIRMHLAGDYHGMAQTLHAQGQNTQALLASRKSIEILLALSQADSANASLRQFLAGAMDVSGDCLLDQGLFPQALDHFRQARQIYAAEMKADPTDALSHRLVGYIEIKIGKTLTMSGKPAAGLEELRQALDIFQALARQAPGSNYLSYNFGNVYSTMGLAHATLATDPSLPASERRYHWREARSAYERSLAIWLDLKRHGKLGGGEIGEPDRIPKEIAKCDKALAQL